MNLGITDTAKVEISISGIEILCLRKLSLVSHALADKIGGDAGREQSSLARALDDVLRRIEVAAATA